MNRFCIVIPLYNNSDTISVMVDKLLHYSLPIIIVDDASDRKTHDIAQQLISEKKDVFCIHRSENGGKGAAVIDGLKWASQNDFTHAIQIDADNQHKIEDLYLFIEASEKNPESLILGKPSFPPDTPKARLWGRKISIVWVHIETLSTAIGDPLFGYRVYPVDSCIKVLQKNKLGKRMDFDPEIAVRLYWHGLDIVNIVTPVTYYEDGKSSYRMFKDNFLISWMHTRLFLGMLLRIPSLLLRKRR